MKKQKLNKFLPRTRCTEDELQTVKSKAKKAGISPSEYQRRACCDSVVIVRENVVDKLAVKELLAIGNNLNQLTHKVHIHNDYDSQELQSILSKIDKLVMGLI